MKESTIGLKLTALVIAALILLSLVCRADAQGRIDPIPGTDFGGGIPICPGDLNHDKEVNSADFSLFRLAYGTREGQPAFNPEADLVPDGRIDKRDYALFQRLYFTECTWP